MKNKKQMSVLIIILVLFVVLAVSAIGIQASTQTKVEKIFQSPTDWRYERLTLPPDFAPGITHKGFEELRFAPGMFDKKSPSFFTYVFLVVLEDTPMKSFHLDDFLLKYYKGLSSLVAKGKKLKVDISATKVKVQPVKVINNLPTATARLTIIDSFSDGSPLDLNMEVRYQWQKKSRRLYITFLVSPQPTSHSIWKKLSHIGQQLNTRIKNLN